MSDISVREYGKAEIAAWIRATTGEFHLDDIAREFGIARNQYNKLRIVLSRLCDEGICKSMGRHDGHYRKVQAQVKPLKFWKNEETGIIDLSFPKGRDGTEFNFVPLINIHKGDAIVLAGLTDKGKTALCLNFLVENMDKMHVKYLCNEPNEYRLKERFEYMDWVSLFRSDRSPDDDDYCKFELISVYQDHEDFIEGADFYIVDWIHIKENFWEVATVIDNIKKKSADAVALVVLQKGEGRTTGIGGVHTLFFADLGLILDDGIITINKGKSKHKITGKSYAFELQDGVKLHSIHEVVHCTVCEGNKTVYDKILHTQVRCKHCQGTGYVDREEALHDVLGDETADVGYHRT